MIYQLKQTDELLNYHYDKIDNMIIYHCYNDDKIKKNLKHFDIKHDFNKENMHISKRGKNVLLTFRFEEINALAQFLITHETDVNKKRKGEDDWLCQVIDYCGAIELRDVETFVDLMNVRKNKYNDNGYNKNII
jgi:hypothetical protein